MALVEAGCVNLARHISDTKAYGVNVVVAVNKFSTKSDAELSAVRDLALGIAVQKACENVSQPLKFLCQDFSIKQKIETLSRLKQIEMYMKQCFGIDTATGRKTP